MARDKQTTATVLLFPSIRMIGRHREAAARIAAAHPDDRSDAWQQEIRKLRAELAALGVGSPEMQLKQQYDFAWSLARELVRTGVRGRFEGWLRNWHPSRMPLSRWVGR